MTCTSAAGSELNQIPLKNFDFNPSTLSIHFIIFLSNINSIWSCFRTSKALTSKLNYPSPGYISHTQGFQYFYLISLSKTHISLSTHSHDSNYNY